MKTRTALLIVSGLLLTGGLTACSAESSKSPTSSNGAAPGPAALAPGAGPDAAGGGKVAAPQPAATLAPADVQRSIIYNGTMTVRVKDVNVAAAAADGIATGTGGYVSGDNRQIDSAYSTATVTLRVPATAFDATVNALHGLGTEVSRQVSTQDVTSQVIDVQSRLKTQQASVDRIRALMANTTSIGQIVSLESELTTREADLESMEAQLHTLTDLTSLSTITVNLLGPEANVTVAPAPRKHGFVAGLKAGWHGFVASLGVVLTVLGAILPFVIAIGLPVWLVLLLVRRQRRRRTQPVLAAPEEKA